MECKRISHSNCIHPEGCAFCGGQCVGLYCSSECYEKDTRRMADAWDEITIDDLE